MKTRNLKSELRLKQKLITRGKGYPGKNEGRDGDFTVRFVPGRGMFLFYKWGNKWYSSRMSIYTPKNSENKQPVIIPSKIPKKVGEIGLQSGKLKIKKGNEKSRQLIAVNNKGLADANTLHFKRQHIDDDTNSGVISAFADYGTTVAGTVKATDTAHGLSTGDKVTISGSTNFNGTFTITKIDNDNFYFTDTWASTAGETGVWTLSMGDDASGKSDYLFENSGHVHLRLHNTAPLAGSAYDSFISFSRVHPETFNLARWTMGYDTSGAAFNWIYRSGSTTSGFRDYTKDTPSTTADSNPKMKLTTTGNLSTVGTLTIGNIASDTAGDNYLVEVSGEVKKRTPAQVLADIGGISFDGSTANGVLTYKDADEMTVESTLTFNGSKLALSTSDAEIEIDKNQTAVTTGTRKAIEIDYDATGDIGDGSTATNIGIDLDINTNAASYHANGISNTTGIDIDLVGGTSGTQTNTGIAIDVDGADTNTGLLINTAGTHIKLEANADANDYATFTLADTGDLTIETVGSGTTDSDLTLDADGDIILDADGQDIYFKDGGSLFAHLKNITLGSGKTNFKLFESAGGTDYLLLSCEEHGASTISTKDFDAAAAHLTLDADGDIILDAASGEIEANATFKIDKDSTATTNGTTYGLRIDYDHTGISASGQTTANMGIESVINSDNPTHVGNVLNFGYKAHLVAGTSGTQSNYGYWASITGADTNVGFLSDVDDGGMDFQARSSADSGDYFSISTTTHGATTLATVDDSGAAAAHLTLDPSGDLIISGADVKVTATKKIYLDGGSDTYIAEHATADTMVLVAGGDSILKLAESGDDGNTATFASAAGWVIDAETFSDDSILSTGGTHDTHIDFRFGNKKSLALTNDIANLNLIFPPVSGNFVLLLTYDGDHDITNWKVYESDESAASGDADVLWAGGSAMATTNAGVDIVSFFWDATNQKCYGVGSTGFAN